jgi:hypothetical protein
MLLQGNGDACMELMASASKQTLVGGVAFPVVRKGDYTKFPG